MKITSRDDPVNGLEIEVSDITKADVWSLDVSLATIALPLPEHYKKEVDGYPVGIDKDDLPPELADAEGIEQWLWILDELIWTMGNIVKFVEDDDESREREGLRLFAKYFRNLWI